MKILDSFAALTYQAAIHAVRVVKIEWRGGDSLAANMYLQVHDSNVTAAEGAVPLKSWPIGTASEGYKEFKRGELNLAAGCYLCVSSTEATKTITSGTDKWAMLSVELAEVDRPENTSQVGDLTTGVTGQQIWSEAAGAANARRLFRLEINGASLGATRYAMLFAKDSPANGDTPLAVWPVTTGTPLTGASAIKFGVNGRHVYSKDSDGTERKGCTVNISSTATTLTLIVSGTATIKGEYK